MNASEATKVHERLREVFHRYRRGKVLRMKPAGDEPIIVIKQTVRDGHPGILAIGATVWYETLDNSQTSGVD